ncbi:terpene synthase family protein [Streptomyces sp. V4I8]|uniref:terpene synthase family protein n=1 Tax=Streptomyces sp. V4I8 TaxID=3156469 RepID=UPI0035146E4D
MAELQALMNSEPPPGFPEVRQSAANTGTKTDTPCLYVSTPSPVKHHQAADLETSLRQWLLATGIVVSRDQGVTADPHRTVERFLKQHVDLITHAWGDVPYGAHLQAAAKWLVITWVIDDHFDDVWIRTSVDQARTVVSALWDILATQGAPAPDSHPLVRAFADLWEETCSLTDPTWQARYRRYYTDWLETALLNLEEFELPGKVPFIAQYLNRRDRDGGLLCTAGWIELAYALTLPDEVFHSPQLFDLLMRFNHIICWVNDLYSAPVEAAAGSGKNLISCYMAYERLTHAQATAQVVALCNAELRTFEFLAGSLHDPDWTEDTCVFIHGLKKFNRALIDWTVASRRYQLTAQRTTDVTAATPSQEK